MRVIFGLTILLTLVSLASVAVAQPFLVADEPLPAGADLCVYTRAGTTSKVAPVTLATRKSTEPLSNVTASQLFCEWNLAGSAIGQNDVTVAYESKLWGVASPGTPFGFVRPASPAAPKSLRLAP